MLREGISFILEAHLMLVFQHDDAVATWWRHHRETLSTLLVLYAGNELITDGWLLVRIYC